MEGLTSVKLITARWNTAFAYFSPWRQKIHALRVAVAGDYSAIDGESPINQTAEESPNKKAKVRSTNIYDVLVRDFEVGVNNEILRAVKTLHQQVTYRAPSFSFENISDMEGAICSMYLQKRLGARPFGCNAILHYKKAVLDYLICGVMATRETVTDGKPEVRYVDLLDLLFDPDADVIAESKWMGLTHVQSISTWLGLYPDNEYLLKRAQELRDGMDEGSDEWLDEPVEVAYYWDTNGMNGTSAVMICDEGGTIDPNDPTKVLEVTENPHFVEFDGFREPFNPITVSTFLELPNVTAATGQAELIIASQVAVHRAERKIQERFENARTFYEVKESDVDEAMMQAFIDGDEDGGIIKTKSGDAFKLRELSEVPQGDMAYIQYHKQQIEELSGADPYASGGKKDGIKFAAEVNAIQSNASLTTSSITADIARHIETSGWKVLVNGANYDDNPLQLTYNQLQLAFGPDDPVGMYLRPDAIPQVNEDDLRFMSRSDKETIASNRLSIAMSYSAIAPASAPILYRRYLEAMGEKDIDAHFQGPSLTSNSTSTGDTTEKVA